MISARMSWAFSDSIRRRRKEETDMLQDRFRKKTWPTGGGALSPETVDITGQVPQIDVVIAEVDEALKKVQQLEEQISPQRRCGC